MHIIYEDNHLIAVNKPFGMPSQGDETGDLSVFDWVQDYLRTAYQKQGNVYTGLLHRIDRPTGGILLLAKTSKAAARLSEDFQQHRIKKTYYAITENTPQVSEGDLRHYLAKLPAKNIMKAYNKPAFGAKEAHLSYKVMQTQDKRALLWIQPHTGRQHQIRVQLASMGCTICGDVKYGRSDFLPDRSIALLAKSLSFQHPVKKENLTLEVPMPDTAIWKLFS